MLGAAASGIIGLAFWRYRMYQEDKINRHKYPLANALRKCLKLSLSSFDQPQGLEFRNMIDHFLVPALQESCGIKVNALTMDETRNIARILADGIRPHLSSRRHGLCCAVQYDFSVLRDKCPAIIAHFSQKMPLASGVSIELDEQFINAV